VLDSLWSKARANSLERLERAKCIDEYATSIQSNRRNLLLVHGDDSLPSPTENYYINGSHIYWGGEFDTASVKSPSIAIHAFGWICSASQRPISCSAEVEDIRKQDSWYVGWLCDKEGLCDFSRSPVEYCLSEPAVPHCKLHFEPTITIIITLLNIRKFKSLVLCPASPDQISSNCSYSQSRSHVLCRVSCP
jgi:hypothetical protein